MSVERLALLALLASLLSVGILIFRGRTRALGIIWVGAVFFMPVWAAISIGIGMQPATYVGLGVLLLTATVSGRSTLGLKWFDYLVLLFFATCVGAAVIGGGSLENITAPVLKWGVGYAVGRTLWLRLGDQFMMRLLAYACGIVAVLAIAEFVFNRNIFFSFPMGRSSGAFRVWGVEQIRAGLWRVEGAFGHSIAFGSVLAMCLPGLVCCQMRAAVKVMLGLVISAAIALTFSRISIVTALIGIALTLLVPGDHLAARARRLGAVAAVVSALGSIPFVLTTVDQAGDEAEGSAEYRDRLWDLAEHVIPVGPSPAGHVSPSGTLYFENFRSIDNAVLLTALHYGWVPVVVAALLLLAGSFAMLRRRFSPPLAGALAQTPGLISVAFITQYEVFYWAMVGMACAAAVVVRQGPGPEDTGPAVDAQSFRSDATRSGSQ